MLISSQIGFDYEIKGNQGIPKAYAVHEFGITSSTGTILVLPEYGFDKWRNARSVK